MNFRISVIFVLQMLLAISCYTQSIDENKIRLENEFIRVGLDREDGQLVEIVDLKSRFNYIDIDHEQGGLWELDLILDGDTRPLYPTQAERFSWEAEGDNKLGLRMIWEKFGLEAAPDLRVIVLVHLHKGQPMSEWQIVVDNLGANGLELIRFPRIHGIPSLGDSERLAVPVWMGRLAKAPRKLFIGSDGQGQSQQWYYPGQLSMQCIALYQEDGPGFYMACDDTAAYRKMFKYWENKEGGLCYEMRHLPENPNTPKDRYELPYGAIIGTFKGDWITAAQRYRAWGKQQSWAKKSRFKKGIVPQWLLETGMWMWNRGRSNGVLPPAAGLQNELGLPVRVFWHWWHGCAYDIGFPEYLPPREGTEPFKDALRQAHKENIRAIVYMNQRLWGMSTESWQKEGAERFAVKDADMKIRSEVYNKFTESPCATMCLGTSFWRNKYAGLAEKAINELGVDGIYMDQASLSLVCYDPNHEHPLGGGNYWIKGFRMLTEEIRRRSNLGEKLLLAGEGCGEAWLPYLDLFLTLEVSRERYAGPSDQWEIIPFFQAVYHAYGITYGSYSSLTEPPYEELWPEKYAPKEPLELLDQKFNRQFFLEQARMFVWGMQPTVANFLPSHMQQRSEEIAYMVRLARIRDQALKYLLYGTFLPPPKLSIPEIDVDMLRLSIYAGQIEGKRNWTQKSDAVLTAAWQSAEGNIGIALANITDEDVSLSFELDAEIYNLHSGGYIYKVGEAGREPVGSFEGRTVSVTLDLTALEACIVEFVRERYETHAKGIRILPGKWRPHYPFEQIAWISPSWPSQDYIWLDFPEAIFTDSGCFYLSHVNPQVDVVFSDLPKVPWQETAAGLSFERVLPNGIKFGGSLIQSESNIVSMNLYLENGMEESLRRIRLQTCAFLRGISEFSDYTLTNKYIHIPGVGWQNLKQARQSKTQGKYRLGFRGGGPSVSDLPVIVTLSNQEKRLVAMTWYDASMSMIANPRHPCMHTDPGFPDLEPGERKTIRGEIIFFTGTLNEFLRWFENRLESKL